MSLNLDKSTWKEVAFGDVIDNVSNRIDDPSKAGVDRYVGLEHLDPGVLTVQRWDSPDRVEAQKLRFEPGDVIFGRRRAYQKKVAVAEFRGICSAHALVLRARPGYIHPDFLPVFLSSDYFLDRATSISVGSLSPTVNWRDLKVQEFALPPFDEQQRIADLLWSLSRHTSDVARQVAAAERLLYALVVTHSWHVRADWPLRQLGSVMTEDSDFVSVESEEEYPVVGVLNRGRGVLLRESIRGSETSYASLNRVRAGQIIYSKLKAFEGSITVVPQHADGRFASQEFPTFRVTDDLDVEFFRLLTTLPEFWELLARTSTGMGGRRERVKPRDFLRLELPLPPLEIQQQIVNYAGRVEHAISEMSAELAALKSFNSTLLADIFGGH